MEIIVGRQGNQKISILDSTVSRQHCKLISNPDGTFTLENLSQNGTFVNGQSVIRTSVTRDTVLQLGATFHVKVADLIDSPAAQPVSAPQAPVRPQNPEPPTKPQEVPSFSIRPMQRVWDEYQETLEDIRAKQKSINTWRMATPLFTMGSGVLTAVTGGNPIGWVLMFIGLAITIYAFVKASNDDSQQRQKDALEKFQTSYICPNPKCGHTHSQSPKVILQNKTCPFCHCKYTE